MGSIELAEETDWGARRISLEGRKPPSGTLKLIFSKREEKLFSDYHVKLVTIIPIHVFCCFNVQEI